MKCTALPLHAIRVREAQGRAQGLPLMQRAGQCAADFVQQHYPRGSVVLLLVGPGNNGGDALTAGLLLLQEGYVVHAVMPQATQPQASDAYQALTQWLDHHPVFDNVPDCTQHGPPQLIIDGLFGIGLNKPLDEPWQTLIDWSNAQDAKVLALDIPSGIMADTGVCLGRPIRADWTLAFIAPCLAIENPVAQPYIGEWTVCSLGLST